MKRTVIFLMAALLITTVISGCGSKGKETGSTDKEEDQPSHAPEEEQTDSIVLSDKIIELADGLSAVRHSGDYGFDEFLAQGGDCRSTIMTITKTGR